MINILLLCNLPLPKISKQNNIKESNYGGWIVSLVDNLTCNKDCTINYLFPYCKDLNGQVDSIKYSSFTKNNITEVFEASINNFKPDIIHIFGTECEHTLKMINVCKKLNLLDKTIINIQGLVSVIAKHYYANLPLKTIYSFTLRELFYKSNVYLKKNQFEKRGNWEVQALQKCKNVIGRTDWDKACMEQINPVCNYFFCNESLREEFYNYSWNKNDCEEYSIFVSQCLYPVKGFHLMLEAMPEILKKHPNVHLYTTGLDPTTIKLKNKYKLGTYKRYLAKLIKKYNLQDKVTFLGYLNEKQMCERYLKSHVFVSASSIENSSNAVAEAMLLGVPVVSSDVGGIKNLLTHEKEGFIYQYDAPYMLSYYVNKIFDNNDIAIELSQNAQRRASVTHDRNTVANTMFAIYNNVIKGRNSYAENFNNNPNI